MQLDAAPEHGPDGSLTIVLSGELDLAQADDLGRLLQRAIRRSPRLTLDLARLTFVDCTILGVLVRSRQLAQQSCGWLRVSGCHPHVRRLLQITDLEEDFGLLAGAGTGDLTQEGVDTATAPEQ